MTILKKIFILFVLIIICFMVCGCNNIYLNCEFESVGVWWWNDNLDEETYLKFAHKNGVTDIYYCNSTFNQKTSNFIKKANDYSINVYFLAGEYIWLENPNNLYNLINEYLIYQNANESKFFGIHLDIEPHQHPEFDTNRTQLITDLIEISNYLKTNYSDIKFAYDIPFWLDDEITFNGKTLPAYAHMIEIADEVHIMSYRDTAEKIYEVSKDEIEFATSINKKIYLGVETYSTEGDNVSFKEEGKKYMYEQINALHALAPNVRINIHHIKRWYDLKN